MRYAIIGSRTFNNYNLLSNILDRHFINLIVSGGAKGADFYAAKYALEKEIPLVEFLPDWDRYGKRAGMLRNKDIIKCCDIVVCFWDGISPGTKSSIDIATKMNKKIIVVNF